uniref:Reverse transcriptase domain-containing protein n=1 Tax=Hymenolepis diminuta TaxID=6216 RepID=A0A0R3SF51_HYMDI
LAYQSWSAQLTKRQHHVEVRKDGPGTSESDTLRREFSFIFLITDIRKPIIGADFLSRFHLLANLDDSSVHDSLTSLLVVLGPIGLHSLLSVNNFLFHILSEYPSSSFWQITGYQKRTLAHGILGIVRTSDSPWASSPHIVAKINILSTTQLFRITFPSLKSTISHSS